MELSTLSAIALGAILNTTQHSEWVTSEDAPRLAKVAETMSAVVLKEGCLFPKEPRCEESTVLALVAVAMHESGFAADVQDCSRCKPGGVWCDRGRAQTLYQMQRNNWDGHTRAEVCRDLTLATTLATRALAKGRGGWKNKFRTYAGRPTSGLELYRAHQTLLLWQSKQPKAVATDS